MFQKWKTDTPPRVMIKSETEVAIEQFPYHLLIRCRGLAHGTPENGVGPLLDDGVDAMLLLAECRARQAKLIDYIEPIVVKERERK